MCKPYTFYVILVMNLFKEIGYNLHLSQQNNYWCEVKLAHIVHVAVSHSNDSYYNYSSTVIELYCRIPVDREQNGRFFLSLG